MASRTGLQGSQLARQMASQLGAGILVESCILGDHSPDNDHERRRSILVGAVKAQAPALVRSCSLDRRVEFGIKNKSSWLPLRAGGGH